MNDEGGDGNRGQDQQRLQKWSDDIGAPPVEDAQPMCARCGEEYDPHAQYDDKHELPGAGPAEYESGYIDVNKFDRDPSVCEDCRELQRYLNYRYHSLTERPDVSRAVAVYCQCQDDDEVDVRPVRRGQQPEKKCLQCGSSEVVLEELPTEAKDWEVEQ